jgi:hypothetical protein
MIALLVLSIILNVVFGVAVVILIRRNFQLVDKMDELGDQVEESLDIFDHCYKQIMHATELPVLSDEPVIRKVLNDIKGAKHAVLQVANKLVTFDEDNAEESKD